MNQPFDWWLLLAGLGLFLFAMNILEKSLKALAGKRFRKVLQNSTDKPIHSVLSGITATTILQSSSLVGLIVLAFVGAGIIPLVNAIGIIIGSNLGTTFTGWIVTTLGFKLNFSNFIYPLLGTSGIVYGLTKGRTKLIAQFILGFALLLMGLDFMKTAASELENLVDFGVLSVYPLITYLFAGAVFTAIIQSSSATMMLTLAALNASIISLDVAAAIVIGADLGTTSTVFLGSLQGGVAKRRIAMAHVIFNFSVDLIAFVFLYPLIGLIQWMELTDPLYSLVAFHSLFNFFGLLVFLPLISQFAKLLERWFPERREPVNLYLKGVPQVDSNIAIEALEKESKQLFIMVNQLILRFLGDKSKLSLHNSVTSSPRDEIEEYMRIKTLEGEIVDYALQIKINDGPSFNGQSQKEAEQIDRLINLVRNSVYAAKAYKDIHQDLESFQSMDNQHFSNCFKQIRQTAIDANYRLNEWINTEEDKLAFNESAKALCEKLDAEHAKILQAVYSNKTEVNLSTIELSTLLNVLREISSSFHSLTIAAKLI
jgi:phosphate:Na+ symporter